ncbi:uncharacterized protein BO95DRAFT_158216 [Aspergillus brunneoviolaceus CBS 621.78]|uniref:Uncharacterized protein n=1 Tax=Aspergillus brunneoviolaceus CBS 621.78 TaxID=1450534 RepID=A0ACD1GMY9_9EURO|nr:hypothetical protein BO95DRAFT_158216 [Aspergillus brunneoviolaceus CBS 621.78]RAH50615.1 hypothetical protein BO95DRAFT_158216 [Aspergillus brunneoviolaceus CBS 621.78]
MLDKSVLRVEGGGGGGWFQCSSSSPSLPSFGGPGPCEPLKLPTRTRPPGRERLFCFRTPVMILAGLQNYADKQQCRQRSAASTLPRHPGCGWLPAPTVASIIVSTLSMACHWHCGSSIWATIYSVPSGLPLRSSFITIHCERVYLRTLLCNAGKANERKIDAGWDGK